MPVKTFKYRLDFYYQQAIVYLVTLVVYFGLRGTVNWEQLPSLSTDPILYIIGLFVIIAFAVLGLNKIRDRRLIIGDAEIVFENKYHVRKVPISGIEWLYIGRERFVQTAGRFQIVVFKIKERRRLFRIRVGRYERSEDLLEEFRRIAGAVPSLSRPTMRSRIAQFGK
jgi:hypothetical protein